MATVTEGYFRCRKNWSDTNPEYSNLKQKLALIVNDDVNIVLHNMNNGNIDKLKEQMIENDLTLNIVAWGYHTNNMSDAFDLDLGGYRLYSTQIYVPDENNENEIIFNWNNRPTAVYDIQKNIIWLLWDASNGGGRIITGKKNIILVKRAIDFFKTKLITEDYDNKIFKKVAEVPTNLKITGLKHFNEAELINKANRLRDINSQITYLLKNLGDYNRSRNILMNEISNLEGQTFKDITITNKYVKHIEVKDNMIDVYTDNIFIKDFEYNSFDRLSQNDEDFVRKVKESGVKLSDCGWYIGYFKISISMKDFTMKFYNLNNKRYGYWGNDNMHPHISYEGIGCLGTLTEMVAFATSEGKIDILIDVLIQYLQSVNFNDIAGRKIVNWDFINLKTNKEVISGNDFVVPTVVTPVLNQEEGLF